MARYDVTKVNLAIDKLLEVTDNPRHRFLLMAFYRHRLLEYPAGDSSPTQR
jgi:hypothetical protein